MPLNDLESRVRRTRAVGAAAAAARPRLLLASIHDVNPRFEREVDALHDRLARHLPGGRVAMLVVPDHWGTSPLAPRTPFAARLRDWAASGVEMFVHGWLHRDDGAHASRIARWKARAMTAREGEFLGLDAADAAARMARGKALLEDIIGRPAAGFVAPAWLYGPGARAALATSGFALAEDHLRVWRPETGETLAFGPVVTWASRSAARIRSSLAVAAAARAGLFAQRVVRVAVHPGDAAVPALTRSIDLTVAALARTRTVGRYADLLDGGAPAARRASEAGR